MTETLAPPLISGGLRSLIHMLGVHSIFEAFKNKTTTVEIPRTLAAAPTTKVRNIPLPKKVRLAADKAAAVDEAESRQLVVVDLGEKKKNPESYGAVFTSEPDDGPCLHCRRQVGPDKVGIPLRIRDDRFHHLLIVDFEGRACHLGCALRFIRDHVAEHSCYEGRETALKQINEICHPGTEIIAAPPWRLHKINGGPYTDEEFDKEKRTFVPTPNLQFRLCSLTFGPA